MRRRCSQARRQASRRAVCARHPVHHRRDLLVAPNPPPTAQQAVPRQQSAREHPGQHPPQRLAPPEALSEKVRRAPPVASGCVATADSAADSAAGSVVGWAWCRR